MCVLNLGKFSIFKVTNVSKELCHESAKYKIQKIKGYFWKIFGIQIVQIWIKEGNCEFLAMDEWKIFEKYRNAFIFCVSKTWGSFRYLKLQIFSKEICHGSAKCKIQKIREYFWKIFVIQKYKNLRSKGKKGGGYFWEIGIERVGSFLPKILF